MTILKERLTDLENYIEINDIKLSNYLHRQGFIPVMRYEGFIYFIKNYEIERVVKEYQV